MTDKLKQFRHQIDALDQRLVKLLSARARLAQRIGKLKESAAYRPEREAQVLRGVIAANRGPLPDAALSRLFSEIMSACRALEDSMTVAYLGPQGTFSQEAAVKHFGGGASLAACAVDRRSIPPGRDRRRWATAWCRSRTRPRARSAARSTCCSRRRPGSAARSCCRSGSA